MRLISAQIQDFRCVEHSGEFKLSDVTCLVGKNESGKTAVLRAMQKLKSDTASIEKFEAAKDYPRRKWRPGAAIPKEPQAITTNWRLDDDDVSALEEQFGPGVLSGRGFAVSKGYDNTRLYVVGVDEAALVKNLVSSAGLSPEDSEPLLKAKNPEEARKALENIASRTPAQQGLLVKIQERFPKGGRRAVITAIDSRVPVFLYFDQYLTLPGTVSVDQIIERKRTDSLTERDQVFLSLLALAGTTLEQVHGAGTFEEFNASLRAVSIQISDQIFAYWSQNKHLEVELKLDHARASDPPPFNQGWIFRTRINNRRHRADTSFDDRSSGFVWFFSFLVSFHQLREKYGRNLIILLDEPGLSLHARAQGDLLRYIREQLKPDYQVVYSTHSPFMIDPDDLLSARTVEDVVEKDSTGGDEKLLGTKVSGKVLSTDADTVSPLQRALDIELTQTLFVGRHTLLVEGPADLLYLKWFSRQLERAGKTGLDYRWNICLIGGVDRIPGFISLFRGNNLHVAAVVDVHDGLRQRIDNARSALAEGHLFAMNDLAEQREADIEDALGREFYIALVSQTLDLREQHELPASKPPSAPERVVREVELHAATLPAHFAAFSHLQPAEWLFQHGDDGAALPGFKKALDRMELLVSRLNALMP